MIRLLRSAPFVPMMFAAVFSLWGDEVDFGDLLGRPETRPSPARAGAATASERLEHASRRLQELQRQAEDSDASAGNPSAGDPDFLRKLRDSKIAVRKAQIRRINGQIAVARKAGSRDKSAYDRRKMTEFQTAFAQYTAKKKSWGYSGKDIDFADWIVRQLKSGKIDPDIQVEDSSYPQYSGPLLRCIMSGRIQKAPEIEKVLVDLGVDVSCLAKSDLPYRGIYAVTHGGADSLSGKLLPLLNMKAPPQRGIKDLLYLNHNVAERLKNGETALHLAAKRAPADVVLLLLCLDADVNARNVKGETPLFEAVKNNRKEIAELLKKAGADPSVRNAEGKTAEDFKVFGDFLDALQRKDAAAASSLIDRGCAVDTVFADGRTALLTACMNQDEDMVKMLLDKGADPNLKGSGYYAPLSVAMERGNPAIFTLLLRKGADPNVSPVGYGGITLLEHLCSAYSRYDEEKRIGFSTALLGDGRTLRGRRIFSGYQSFLTQAVRSRRSEAFVRNCLKHVDALEFDDPVLVYAVDNAYSDNVIRLLIEKKANVNAVSADRTPLWLAVRRNRMSVVQMLLNAGADPNWCDKNGNAIRTMKCAPAIRRMLDPDGAHAEKAAASRSPDRAPRASGDFENPPLRDSVESAPGDRAPRTGGVSDWLPGPSGQWHVRMDTALAAARREQKKIFVLSTGSDWCGWCKKLYREVLSASDFIDLAKRKMILVYLDNPRSKAMPELQKLYNRELIGTLRRGGGVPCAFVLDEDARLLGSIVGYRPRPRYMQSLREILETGSADRNTTRPPEWIRKSPDQLVPMLEDLREKKEQAAARAAEASEIAKKQVSFEIVAWGLDKDEVDRPFDSRREIRIPAGTAVYFKVRHRMSATLRAIFFLRMSGISASSPGRMAAGNGVFTFMLRSQRLNAQTKMQMYMRLPQEGSRSVLAAELPCNVSWE